MDVTQVLKTALTNTIPSACVLEEPVSLDPPDAPTSLVALVVVLSLHALV